MKKMLSTLLTLVLVLSCFASTAAFAAEKEIVQIATPIWYLPCFEEIAAQYAIDNPDSPYQFEIVEIVADGTDLGTKTIMMMSSPDTCPAASVVDGFMVNDMSLAGLLYCLDDYAANWSEIPNWVPSTLDGARCEDDNGLYAIPLTGAFTGLWYNKILAKEAGYDPETFQPASWDEMLVAARAMDKAANRDEFIPMYLFASTADAERTSMKPMQALLSGTDGVLYDFETKKWNVDKTNLGKVLGLYDLVYNVEKIGPPASLVTQSNNVALITSDDMKKDNVGLIIDSQNFCNVWGPNGPTPWAEWNDHYGFCLLPTEKGGERPYTSILGGWTIGIPENSTNKDGAMEFIKTLGTYENMLKFALDTNNMTPRPDVAATESYKNNDVAVYSFIDVTSAMIYGFNRPTTDGYTVASLLVAEMAEMVATGTMTVEEAINNYAEQLSFSFGDEKVALID